MKAKVSLVARVNDTGFPFVAVECKRNAILFPIVRREGKRDGILQTYERDQIIGFYARYQVNGHRKIKPLGKDPVSAYTDFLKLEKDFSRVRAGLLPIHHETLDEPKAEKAPKKESRSLADCAKIYRSELETLGRKPRAIETCCKAVDQFIESYKKDSIDAITRQDCLDFIDWMRLNIKKRNNGGHPNNTYRNRLQDVKSFLKRFDVNFPLPTRDWPKEVEKKKEKFSIDVINKLLNAPAPESHSRWTSEDEKDLIAFFLNTGFRDDEAAHCQYSDIDFARQTINMGYKPEFNWTTKNSKARREDIHLSDKFIKRMKARQKRFSAKPNGLIFPSTKTKPDEHLLRVVKRVAKRAGVDVSIGLHKFRKTYGTMVTMKFGLEAARIRLGHEDMATTQGYIAADDLTQEQSRKGVNEMFAGVGD